MFVQNPLRLQNLICNGDDLFDQWNEFYDFRSLFTTIIFGESVRMPATYRDLPSIIRLKPEHYKYLLPGHCWRVDVPQPILHV
jgi:beta-1,4-mannosyl-glycoprotein beta-1,4-N-acetylglucosaminyltransferase